MGRIEDFAAKKRPAGLSLDDHMLYTMSIDPLPTEYEVEAWNLASRDSIGHDNIFKTVRERHHRFPENKKKGSNVSHAGGGDDGGYGYLI